MNATPLAPVADRAMVLTNMLMGLAAMHLARPNMHIEWSGGHASIIVRETDGWALTRDVWVVTFTPHNADVLVTDTDGNIRTLPPTEALVYLHNVIMRAEYRTDAS